MRGATTRRPGSIDEEDAICGTVAIPRWNRGGMRNKGECPRPAGREPGAVIVPT